MNLKNWLHKKKETPVEPPTRAAIMVELFVEWGNDKPFTHNGLVGTSRLTRYAAWYTYYIGNVIIQHDNVAVLNIDKDWMRSSNSNKSRATTYDETYSEQLDEYMEALKSAIAERDEAKRKAEEAAETQRIFEETRF